MDLPPKENVPSQPTVSESRFTRKQIIIGGALFLILAVLSYLIVLALTQPKVNSSQAQSTSNPVIPTSAVASKSNIVNNPSETTSPIPTIDPAWKTFNNTPNNYSFKYPPQFTITQITKNVQMPDFQNPNIQIAAVQTQYFFTTGRILNGKPDSSSFIVTTIPAQGRTIEQEFAKASTPVPPIRLIPIVGKGNANEADNIVGLPDGNTVVYRTGNRFVLINSSIVGVFEDESSDDLDSYLPSIISSYSFK